ncbi:MAG TPA: DinB family protein, partial [Thermoanaerobaculaceae bacterium]|nr:DinB family protein [Thermoanaerobaculaceae bacterium]
MIRTVADFETIWRNESEITAGVLAAVTDASLAQRVTPKDRTLGDMAWHMATTIPEMMERTGLAIEGA